MIDFDELSEPGAARRARLAALQERAEKLKAIEEEQERQARERATAHSLEVHRRHVMDQYRAAGVEPPLLNETNGAPLVSLSLLLKYGWTIEALGDQNVLVPPTVEPERPRRSRQDYQNVDGS